MSDLYKILSGQFSSNSQSILGIGSWLIRIRSVWVLPPVIFITTSTYSSASSLPKTLNVFPDNAWVSLPSKEYSMLPTFRALNSETVNTLVSLVAVYLMIVGVTVVFS